jgi:hypothetical protein
MVLAGELNPGDTVTVDARDGRIEIDVTPGEAAAEAEQRASRHRPEGRNGGSAAGERGCLLQIDAVDERVCMAMHNPPLRAFAAIHLGDA